MANFSGKQNLLGFKGAQLMTGIDQKNPSLLYVCIPVAYNDIEVSRDGRYANAGIYISETGDNFRQACIQRKQQSGDDMTGYTPPSHQMEVNFSKEFKERALQAAKNRLLREHPEWTGDLADPEHNKDLKNAMYDAVRCRLGSLYIHYKRTDGYGQQPAQQPAYQQAAQPYAYDPSMGYNEQQDDLPF